MPRALTFVRGDDIYADQPQHRVLSQHLADGSSFNEVIPDQADGHEVMAAQYGLDTLESDVATVKRTLGRVSNPAKSRGHSARFEQLRDLL